MATKSKGGIGGKYARRKVADLASDPANARKHSDRNLDAIKASLTRFGQQKPIVIDSSGVVRAGNGTLMAAKALGWAEIDVVVSDLQGAEATAYAIADNRTAELAEWDDDVLTATLQSLADEDASLLLDAGYDEKELAKLVAQTAEGSNGDGLSDRYTKKIVAPTYEPHGPCPPVADLYDQTKTAELVAEVDAAEVPEDVRRFLVAAAQRHTVINFRQVAEFYAHASPDLQRLMERSALVVIDFDDAIANGFVRLTKQLGELADTEGESGEGDA